MVLATPEGATTAGAITGNLPNLSQASLREVCEASDSPVLKGIVRRILEGGAEVFPFQSYMDMGESDPAVG